MIRMFATVLGLVALAAAMAGFGARYLPITGHTSLIVAAASPYLALAAPVAVVLMLVGRRWILSVVALAVVAALVWVYVPRYQKPPPAGVAAVDLRMLTTNLRIGHANPAELVALARDSADIVTVQEMTPKAAEALSEAGMDARFPYRVLLPARPVGGIGIWSRYPIVNSGRIDGYTLWMVAARIRVPGVAVDATVLSVHMAGPWPQPIGQWTADMARFPATLRDIAHSAGAGAVIVAGDFNATADMAPFRNLLGGGYTDAAAEAGAGLARTFPNRPPWPALLGIDHFLLRNCTPASVHTARVDGTDHLSLLATLRVPVDMTGR